MIKAYVLISVAEEANPAELASEMMLWEEIDNLHLIYGEWDIVAYVEVGDVAKLRNFSLNKLLKKPGISRTQTLIIAEKMHDGKDSKKV
jgi:DNA-binding Lrp family transcriptional regulator